MFLGIKNKWESCNKEDIRPLNSIEKHSEVEQEKIRTFDRIIQSLYGQYDQVPDKGNKTNHPLNQYEVDYDESFDSRLPEAEEPIDASGKQINQQPLYDKLVKAEVTMPHKGSLKTGKVVGRTVANDGKVYGTYDEDPYRNTVSYDVEF